MSLSSTLRFFDLWLEFESDSSAEQTAKIERARKLAADNPDVPVYVQIADLMVATRDGKKPQAAYEVEKARQQMQADPQLRGAAK